MATKTSGYYDPTKDYSLAIKEAQASGASQSQINQLQQERQNKINAQYGGVEPNMYNSDKTFSQVYGSGASGGSSSSVPQKGPGYVTGGYDTGALGSPILNTNPYYTPAGGADKKLTPDMSRRPDLAGGYATSNGFTVFYDEDGYATHASEGSADYRPTQDWYVKQGTYNGGNLWTDEEILTPADLQRVESIRAQLRTGQITGDQANQLANQIRSGYGYTIDKAGNVTDLGVASTVNARRQQWGMPTNGVTPEQAAYLQAMFPELGTGDANTLLQAQLGLVNGTYHPGSTGADGLDGNGTGWTGADGMGGMTSFQDFLSQMGFDQYSDATQQRIRAAVQQAVNNYNAQIDEANRETDELARQAYVASMMGQRNLDQQLSAAGYAGGMADSQRIQMQANYENNLRELETQRLDVVSELERAIQDAQLTGDLQTAQELQAYLQQMQGSWLSYVQNQQAMAQQNYWNQQNMNQQNYWNQQNMALSQQQMSADRTAAAYDRALQLLGLGVMPGTDILAQAGLSQQEAEAIRATALAELNGGTTGTSGRSSGSSGASGSSGNTGNSVNTPVVNSDTGTGMPLESIVSQLRNLIGRGRVDDAMQVLQRYWTPQNVPSRIQKVLGEYGYSYVE